MGSIASGSSSPAPGTRAFAIPAASPSRAASMMSSPRATADGHAAQERVAAPDRVGATDRRRLEQARARRGRDDRPLGTERDDGRRRAGVQERSPGQGRRRRVRDRDPGRLARLVGVDLHERGPLGEHRRERRAVRVGEHRAPRAPPAIDAILANPSGGAPGGRLPDNAIAATSPSAISRSTSPHELVPRRLVDGLAALVDLGHGAGRAVEDRDARPRLRPGDRPSRLDAARFDPVADPVAGPSADDPDGGDPAAEPCRRSSRVQALAAGHRDDELRPMDRPDRQPLQLVQPVDRRVRGDEQDPSGHPARPPGRERRRRLGERRLAVDPADRARRQRAADGAQLEAVERASRRPATPAGSRR